MTAIAPSNSRGMGWRKPVPVYIPTPPNSRPTSDTLFAPATVFSGGDAGKQPPAEGPKDGLPPMPEDWLSIVRSVSHDFYHDSSRFRLAVGTANPERQPVYAQFSRTLSSTADYYRPQSSRSHYTHRGALPRVYRPPTPPRSARRPSSCDIPNMQEAPSSLGSPYRMIFPDPPSIFMNTSRQIPRHPPAPSLSMSESTHNIPASVKTKRSLQSLTSSEGHTAVTSHAETGSWYINGYPEALDQLNAKKVPPGSIEVGGKSELPMHYIPASRLKKTRKGRSCSDMLWGTIVSAGRAIASVFKTDTVESVPPLTDKL